MSQVSVRKICCLLLLNILFKMIDFGFEMIRNTMSDILTYKTTASFSFFVVHFSTFVFDAACSTPALIADKTRATP